MDFVTSNFGKMKLWPVEHLLNTFSTYLSSKLVSPSLLIRGEFNHLNVLTREESNFDDKYVEQSVQHVFNWSEFHLSEMTCYKIHTLVFLQKINLVYLTSLQKYVITHRSFLVAKCVSDKYWELNSTLKMTISLGSATPTLSIILLKNHIKL